VIYIHLYIKHSLASRPAMRSHMAGPSVQLRCSVDVAAASRIGVFLPR